MLSDDRGKGRKKSGQSDGIDPKDEVSDTSFLEGKLAVSAKTQNAHTFDILQIYKNSIHIYMIFPQMNISTHPVYKQLSSRTFMETLFEDAHPHITEIFTSSSLVKQTTAELHKEIPRRHIKE